MKEATEFITKYHGQDISKVVGQVKDVHALSIMARKLMLTNFKGWKQNGDQLVYGGGELTLPATKWVLNDGMIRPNVGVKLDNDWLYMVAAITEQDVAASVEAAKTPARPEPQPKAEPAPQPKAEPKAEPETKPKTVSKTGDDRTTDAKTLGSNLSRAGSILNTLDDNKVMNYLEDAVRAEHNTEEATKQRTIWEQTGVNWKFEGIEVKNGDIALFIKVVYSIDGTQSGVKEKTLTIRVQPTPESTIS